MVEKLKNHLKKHEFLYCVLAVFFSTSGIVLSVNHLEVGDKLWLFSNVYKLLNGVKLYADNNIIDTPLSFWIGALFLKLFGANFFVYKILTIFTLDALFLLILKTLKKIGVPYIRSYIFFLIIIMPFCKDFLYDCASYNTYSMLFWVLGISLFIKKDNLKINPIQQGIISALVFASKQNVGIYYLMAVTIFTIYYYRKNIRQMIKTLFSIYMVFILCTSIWMGVLVLQGQLKEFINYALGGIGEFAQKNISGNISKILFLLIPIIFFIVFIVNRKKGYIKEERFINISIFLIIFMLANLFVAYPIFNDYHIEMALITTLIYVMFVLNEFIKKLELNLNIRIIHIIVGVSIILIIGINIKCAVYAFKTILDKNYEYEYNHPYFGMYLKKEESEKVKKIVEFIQLKNNNGQNVIIFSSEADIFRNILKQNYQDFDLPFLGNWGYKGEERVWEKLKNMKNSFVLIKDSDPFEQESKEIKNKIRQNYNKTGEIEGFEIYYIE